MSYAAPPTSPSMERALDLHRRALVLDAHVDTVSEMLDKGYHLGNAPDSAHLSWEKIARGGLKGQLFACYVDPALPPDGYADRVDRIIDRFEAEVARFPDRLACCRSAGEIERAVAAGRFAGMLSIEGGHAIQDSLDLLRHFHRRGVRAMTLTWNNTNGWADGCGPMDPALRQHGGLTEFGRTVVAAMEEIGMAVDVSHAAPATFDHVLTAATKPPFASHSSLRALNDHRRNLTDDQARRLGERGGVLGVCFFSGFLVDEMGAWAGVRQTPEYAALAHKSDSPEYHQWTEEEFELYQKRVPLAALDDAVAHVDHALRIMGTGHVALGTDFDGARRFPDGLNDVGHLPALTAALLDRGWKPSELEGMLGRNLLEYFRGVVG